MKRITRIAVASDFSAGSRRAFNTALTLARASHASVTAFHVIPPTFPVVPEQYLDRAIWDRFDRQARRAADRRLQRLTLRANRAGVRATGRVLRGDPAVQIVRAARAARADFLVIGTHGRTGLRRLFMGSVAARVVAMARCPVVIVRG